MVTILEQILSGNAVFSNVISIFYDDIIDANVIDNSFPSKIKLNLSKNGGECEITISFNSSDEAKILYNILIIKNKNILKFKEEQKNVIQKYNNYNY